MANEIIKNENECVSVELVEEKQKFNYNAKIGDEIIGLKIKCKRIKNDKLDFNSIKGMLFIPVFKKNKNGETVCEGKFNRWIDVHFKKDAFKGVSNECDVHNPDELTTGTLFVCKKGIQVPSKYVVTKDEIGEDVYPQIWIKSNVVGFIPYTPDDEMFEYHEPVKIDMNSECDEVTEEDQETVAFTDSNN